MHVKPLTRICQRPLSVLYIVPRDWKFMHCQALKDSPSGRSTSTTSLDLNGISAPVTGETKVLTCSREAMPYSIVVRKPSSSEKMFLCTIV